MNLVVISVPTIAHAYQVGAENAPSAWQSAGLMESLAPLVERAVWVSLQRQDGQEKNVSHLHATALQLRDTVFTIRKAGAIPLVLGGDPGLVALGTMSGLQKQAGPGRGIAWFDAYNRFGPGEVLALLAGWEENPIGKALQLEASAEWQILLAGDREQNLVSKAAIEGSAVSHWEAQDLDLAGAGDLGREVSEWPSLYLHLDLAVLDPGIMPAVNRLLPGGLAPETLVAGIESVAAASRIEAVGITGYNPRHDSEGLGLESSLQVIQTVVGILSI